MTDASLKDDPAASQTSCNILSGTTSRPSTGLPGAAAAAMRGAHHARSASGVRGGNSWEMIGNPARVASGVRSRCVPTATVAPLFAARCNANRSSGAGMRSASSQ
ncbi:hypothetical protein [Alienimonas sp. DA493]|uniref:hypothetical protein n=1 Tax=Alienimonas sp. DA493 TaxID=3373605 RepID=UPI003754BE41